MHEPDLGVVNRAFEEAFRELYRGESFADKAEPDLRRRYFDLIGNVNQIRVESEKLLAAFQKRGLLEDR